MDPTLIIPSMPNPPKLLGMVRVWREGDLYKWVPADQRAPEHAELATQLRTDDEEVIYINRGHGGDFIRGAVKGWAYALPRDSFISGRRTGRRVRRGFCQAISLWGSDDSVFV